MRWRGAVLCLCLLAAACAETVTAPTPRAPAPDDFPADRYAEAAANGQPMFRIDPERSILTVRVYRGGPLALFGHDHIVASRDVRGYVLRPAAPEAASADLYAPLELLTVDEPALRAEAGFDTQPSDRDIAGTRRNMLEKVLEAERYPWVMVHLEPSGADATAAEVSAKLTLHGETRLIPIVLKVNVSEAGTLYAAGRFSLKQTDFGIAPFTALGGALRVKDRVDLEFSVYGVRVSRDEVLE